MAWEYSTGQVCQDLAWEKLHTGNWKTVSPVSFASQTVQLYPLSYCAQALHVQCVPVEFIPVIYTQEMQMLQVWRDLFSYACLVAALVHLQQLDPSLHEAQALIMSEGGIGTEAASSSKPKGDSPQKAVATAMHELDMAAIMGGPLFRTEIDSLIYAVQSLHQQRLDTFVAHTPVKRRFDVISSSDRPDSCCKQRKAPVHRSQTKQQTSDKLPGKVSVARFAHYVDSGNAARQQVQQLTEDPALLPPGSLLPHCTRVPSEQLPSMER